MTSTENRTDFGNKRLIQRREAFYLFNCTVETSKVNGKQKFKGTQREYSSKPLNIALFNVF